MFVLKIKNKSEMRERRRIQIEGRTDCLKKETES